MKEPNLIEKAFILKKTSIFSEINLDNLLLIADKVDTIPIPKGQVLFKEGQLPQYFYIIFEGEIEISHRKLEKVQLLSSGDLFGDVSLFQGSPYEHKAVAKTQAILIALTKKQMTSILAECPSVAIKLLEKFSLKIQDIDLDSQKKESL